MPMMRNCRNCVTGGGGSIVSRSRVARIPRHLRFAPIYRLVDTRVVPISLEALEALVGTGFPGGSYTIEPYRHWLMNDAVGDRPTTSGTASPMEIYYGAMAGLGLTLDELFALA